MSVFSHPRAALRSALFSPDLIAAALVVAFVGIASTIHGCLPRPDCTPHAQSCDDAGVARLCSSSGHGWAASGRPQVSCATIGGVCVVVGGRVTCANPRRDGGADASDATADADDASEVAVDVQSDGE